MKGFESERSGLEPARFSSAAAPEPIDMNDYILPAQPEKLKRDGGRADYVANGGALAILTSEHAGPSFFQRANKTITDWISPTDQLDSTAQSTTDTLAKAGVKVNAETRAAAQTSEVQELPAGDRGAAIRAKAEAALNVVATNENIATGTPIRYWRHPRTGLIGRQVDGGKWDFSETRVPEEITSLQKNGRALYVQGENPLELLPAQLQEGKAVAVAGAKPVHDAARGVTVTGTADSAVDSTVRTPGGQAATAKTGDVLTATGPDGKKVLVTIEDDAAAQRSVPEEAQALRPAGKASASTAEAGTTFKARGPGGSRAEVTIEPDSAAQRSGQPPVERIIPVRSSESTGPVEIPVTRVTADGAAAKAAPNWAQTAADAAQSTMSVAGSTVSKTWNGLPPGFRVYAQGMGLGLGTTLADRVLPGPTDDYRLSLSLGLPAAFAVPGGMGTKAAIAGVSLLGGHAINALFPSSDASSRVARILEPTAADSLMTMGGLLLAARATTPQRLAAIGGAYTLARIPNMTAGEATAATAGLAGTAWITTHNPYIAAGVAVAGAGTWLASRVPSNLRA